MLDVQNTVEWIRLRFLEFLGRKRIEAACVLLTVGR